MGGNCIACVCDLVKFLTEPLDGKPGAFPKSALDVLDEARKEDMLQGETYRNLHLLSTTGVSGVNLD